MNAISSLMGVQGTCEELRGWLHRYATPYRRFCEDDADCLPENTDQFYDYLSTCLDLLPAGAARAGSAGSPPGRWISPEDHGRLKIVRCLPPRLRAVGFETLTVPTRPPDAPPSGGSFQELKCAAFRCALHLVVYQSEVMAEWLLRRDSSIICDDYFDAHADCLALLDVELDWRAEHFAARLEALNTAIAGLREQQTDSGLSARADIVWQALGMLQLIIDLKPSQ